MVCINIWLPQYNVRALLFYTLLINDFVKFTLCLCEFQHVRMARAAFTFDTHSKKLRMISIWQLLQTGYSSCRLEKEE